MYDEKNFDEKFKELGEYYNINSPKEIRRQLEKNENIFTLLEEVKPYLENKLVIAHNTSFDISVLCKTLEQFGIELPTFEYLCTVKLSQKAYPDLMSHKLNCLGHALGIDFSHHTACDDAYACAKVLTNILEDFGIETKEELCDKFDIGIGRVYPGYVEPCKKNKKKSRG